MFQSQNTASSSLKGSGKETGLVGQVSALHVCNYYVNKYFSFCYHFAHTVCLLFLMFQELVMDILRVLSAPDLEVRKKVLNLALDLVTSRTTEEVRLY